MISLEDAWRWYRTLKGQIQILGRLGRKHWDELPWDGPLGKDDRLRTIDASTLTEDSRFCLEHVDDFAIVVLFSVFESVVRDHALGDLRAERSRLGHPLLLAIVDEAIQDLERGSFYRVLDTYKGRDHDLIEEANQVRRYRNWVAHGRRTDRPEAVDPEAAYDRLRRFLDLLADRGTARDPADPLSPPGAG